MTTVLFFHRIQKEILLRKGEKHPGKERGKSSIVQLKMESEVLKGEAWLCQIQATKASRQLMCMLKKMTVQICISHTHWAGAGQLPNFALLLQEACSKFYI